MHVRLLVCVGLTVASSSAAWAAPRAFLEKHCIQCHDAEIREGGVDLAGLPFDLEPTEAFATWVKVHDRIAAGEMPPREEPRPPESERGAVTRELAAALVSADRKRLGGEPRTTIRRLTRTEYENTVRDLFDLPGIALKELLPPDGSAHGFDKNADALDISHVNMNAYMAAADAVLDVAIAIQPSAPAVKKQRMSLAITGAGYVSLDGDCVLLKDKRPDPRMPPATSFKHIDLPAHNKIVFSDAGTVGVLRQGDDFQPYFSQFVAIYPAKYLVRTSLWGFMWDKGTILPARDTEVARLMTVHLTGNGSGGGYPSDLIAYFDAPSIDAQVHEITAWFNPNDTLSFGTESLLTPFNNRAPGGIMGCTVPGIACDYVEIEGPLYESWPPRSHVRLFGDLPLVEFKNDEYPDVRPPQRQSLRQIGAHIAHNKPDPVSGVWTVKSDRPLDDADRLLADFLPRAFRRPVPDDTRREYLAQVATRLKAGDCYETALRWAYRLALCAPDFVYHVELANGSSPGGDPVDDYALANRLSYFLWNTLPDERLRELAAAGKLHEPPILADETERMLADSRSHRFVEDFLGQWLKLRTIGKNDVDKVLYPEFQKYLQDSMIEETRAYFSELIDRDLDATHLVKSDFAMLNGRLALHYGIDGVEGTKIQRVSLPAESPRGPFLTQAAVLKITANGTVTSPVPRGAFVMERLLGQPPEPPPEAVPAVEPDVRGATTIRAQLALHRDNQACAGCHAKFDPAGFALESFDVIGGERTWYRATQDGTGKQPPRSKVFERLDIHGGFRIGPEVDPSGTLLDGRDFRNVREFQGLVASNKSQLLTNMARQFLIYGTGRDIAFADRDAVAQIVTRTAEAGGGLRTLICEIVGSKLFQTP